MRIAEHICSMPSPKFSRRCPVISTMRRSPRAAYFSRHGRPWFALAGDGPQQGVDHRVAGHVDTCGGRSFTPQILGRPLGRRTVQRGDQAGDAAVEFLGPGGLKVAGAQAGLDVNQRHAAVKRGQRGRHDRGRVALGDNAVGPALGQHGVEARQAAGGHLGQRLIRATSDRGRDRPRCRNTPSPDRASGGAGRSRRRSSRSGRPGGRHS